MIVNRISWKSVAVWCLMATLAPACSRGSQDVPPLRVQRLDSAMAVFASLPPARRAAVRDSFRPAFELMAAIRLLPAVTDSAIEAYADSPASRIFLPDVSERLTQLDSLEQVMGAMYGKLSGVLPSVRRPLLYGFESPYMQSVYTSGQVVLVALNHYLGPGYPGYDGFEAYQKRRKRAPLLPYNLLEAQIGSVYPAPDHASAPVTALSAMLHEGAVLYALMAVVPDASLADAGGWTPSEVEWMESNERMMWETLTDNNLLYNSDPMIVRRLVGVGPSTPVINANAPGAAGRYIGYRIVEEYCRNHPGTTLDELLSEQFCRSRSTLVNAGYGWRK